VCVFTSVDLKKRLKFHGWCDSPKRDLRYSTLRITLQTHISPKWAFQALSKNIFILAKKRLWKKLNGLDWISDWILGCHFLLKSTLRAQKNYFFSRLSQFQRNPRYAFESPWYALSRDIWVGGLISSRFEATVDFSKILRFHIADTPRCTFWETATLFSKTKIF